MSQNEGAPLHYKDRFYTDIVTLDLSIESVVKGLEQLIVLPTHAPRPNFDLERNYSILAEIITTSKSAFTKMNKGGIKSTEQGEEDLVVDMKLVMAYFGLINSTRSGIREDSNAIENEIAQITKEKSRVLKKLQNHKKAGKPKPEDQLEFKGLLDSERSLREGIQPVVRYTIIDGEIAKGFEYELPNGIKLFWTEPKYLQVPEIKQPEKHSKGELEKFQKNLVDVFDYTRARSSLVQMTINKGNMNYVFRMHSYDNVKEIDNSVLGKDTYRLVFQQYPDEQEKLLYGKSKASIGAFDNEFTEKQIDLLQMSYSFSNLTELSRLSDNKGIFPRNMNWFNVYSRYRAAFEIENPILDVHFKKSENDDLWLMSNYPKLDSENLKAAVDYIDNIVTRYINNE